MNPICHLLYEKHLKHIRKIVRDKYPTAFTYSSFTNRDIDGKIYTRIIVSEVLRHLDKII